MEMIGQEEIKVPVHIVTIKSKTQLFRDEEPATGIELIELEEFGYQLISQIGLYQPGDKAVYIMPDYSLSDIPLFDSFTKPYGDPKKCRLGSRNRIRAIKFNHFYTKESNDTIYSNGILLPYKEVSDYLNIPKLEIIDLTAALGIVKWEEQDPNSGGLNTGKSKNSFPVGMYKTDEENINNVWNHIERKIGYPITFIGTEKVDGSSITIFIRNGVGGICSRNLEKELTYNKVVGRRKKTWLEQLMFWKKKFKLNIYEEVENDTDDFVKYGKPYLDALFAAGYDNIALRGELNGSHLKGSGNKNNPSRKEKPNIKFFGMDICDTKEEKYIKADHSMFVGTVEQILKFDRVKTVFMKEFNSREEIEHDCNAYFTTNPIEGIVVRTPDSTFSSKIMNLDYDSKK